jgi:transposase-like protein
MRYPASEKLEIIRLVEHSHLPVKQTLDKLGIPRTTFYRWYDRYQIGGPEALEDQSPRPSRVWNRIPDDIRQRIVDLALDVPELSPRELAVRFTDTEKYFVSEASVYRLFKSLDLITSPAFIVNGQKIWTTMGNEASWMFALVRTNPDALKKQGGLSVILIDLASPGITRRPIKVLSGDDELAEEIFDDVRVPAENLVGELHDGWRVANSILGTERFTHGHPRHLTSVLDAVKRMARKTGAMDDAAFRDRLAGHEINVTAFAAFFRHALELANADISPGWAASILKLYCTEEIQRLDDLLAEAAGGHGLDKNIVDTVEGGVDIMGRFLGDRRNTIGGGSREIQRNIISKRILGLPT